MASALKKQPTDLALLSKNNGGKYPAVHVISVLKFGSANPSHGTAQMPVWGPVFSNLDTGNTAPNVKALRINNLSQYLETLQAK